MRNYYKYFTFLVCTLFALTAIGQNLQTPTSANYAQGQKTINSLSNSTKQSISPNSTTIASGLTNPQGTVVIGDNLFISNRGAGNIVKIDLTTPNAPFEVITGGYNIPIGIAAQGNIVYFSDNNNGGSIYSFDSTETTPLITTVVTNIGGVSQEMTIVGNDLFFTPNNSVRKLDISTPGAPVEILYLNGLETSSLDIAGSTLYFGDFNTDSRLFSIDLSLPNAPNVLVGNYGAGIINSILADGDDLYIADGGLDTISILDITQTPPPATLFESNTNLGLAMSRYNDDLIFASFSGGTIEIIEDVFTTGSNLPPTAVCANISIDLDASGNATIVAADVDGGSTDNDGSIASISVNVDTFSCNNIGANTVTLTVTDNEGATSTCTATVTVNDITAPVLSCSSPITISNASGSCDAVVTFATPTAIDSCESTGTLTEVLNNFNANFATITANIPTPNEFVLDGPDGVNGTNISDGNNDLYDGGNFINTNISGTSNIQYSDDLVIPSASFGASGAYFTRKVANMWVMVADLDTVDTFNISGNLGADGSGTADGFIGAITVDGLNYTILVKRVFNSNDPSINHLIIIPEDSGVTQSFPNNTNDDQHDIAGLTNSNRLYYLLFSSGDPSTSVFIDDATMETIATSFINETVNNTPLIVTQTAGPVSGSTFPVGTTEVTFSAMDASGNSSTCSFDVVVEDTETPTINCPADETVIIDEGTQYTLPDYIADGTVTFTDNCTALITSQSPAPGTMLSGGTFPIVFNITDAGGNTATCDFELIVDEILGINDSSTSAFSLFPNPATTQITIEGDFDIATVEVFNLLGQKVLTSTSEILNIENLSSAMYLVKITDTEGNEATKRFIKK